MLYLKTPVNFPSALYLWLYLRLYLWLHLRIGDLCGVDQAGGLQRLAGHGGLAHEAAPCVRLADGLLGDGGLPQGLETSQPWGLDHALLDRGILGLLGCCPEDQLLAWG